MERMMTNNLNEFKAYQLIVRGRVQRVGFRYFTKIKAEDFALAGWVRNTPTGNVKIFVQGKQNNIDIFINQLKIGPPSAIVKDIERIDKEINPDLKRFEVKFF